MKITKVSTAVVEGNFDWTYVRVETDKGVRGLGESFFAPGLTAIIREMSAILIGEDPRNIDRLVRKMQRSASGAGSSGIVSNAISGIETALWDLLGRSLKAPVYQLLGGKFRDSVRIYTDCHGGEGLESYGPLLVSRCPGWASDGSTDAGHSYWSSKREGVEQVYSADAYARRAVELKDRGFTALKFDIDVPNPYTLDDYSRCLSNSEVAFMVGLVRGVREAIGPEMDLAIDCHWRYNVSDILKVAWQLEDLNLMWLEDPVPPENIEAMKSVTNRTRTPVCSGENLCYRSAFRQIIDSQALNILAPDVQKVGGLLETKRIADMADLQYMALAPHNISSPIGTMASAHLCAAIPNFLVLEYHALDVPFWEDLAIRDDKRPVLENGYIRVPDSPGLGVELNEEVARRYAKPGEPFFDEE